jgi:Skp family chaperone for outer membrane proteins
MKKLSSIFVLMSLLVCSSSAFAEKLGIVDITKAVNSYYKTQNANTDLSNKESELQKYIIDAKLAIQSTKSDTDKKTLQDKYAKEISQKQDDYKQLKLKYVSETQKDLLNVIRSVAKENQYTAVFNKDSVILGLDDLTDKVINSLNSRKN